MTFFNKILGLPEKRDRKLCIPLPKDLCERYHWSGKNKSDCEVNITIDEETITMRKVRK